MAAISSASKPAKYTLNNSSLQPMKNALREDVENRTHAVVEQLAEMILNGVIEAGSPLPSERVLARQLGVARNVPREATKILESRGLVTVRHGMRTIVNGVTSEPVQQAVSGALHGKDDALLQLTEVRLVLEVGIAGLAAQCATEDDIAVLRGVLDSLTASVDDPAHYAELDIALHRALAAATHNAIFVLLLDSIEGLLRQSRDLALRHYKPQDSLGAHQDIFEAVEAHDTTRAAEAMRYHLQRQKIDFEALFNAST